MEYSIPHKRELRKEEVELLSFLFKREKPEWLEIIDQLKVIARCACGECPTIMFGKSYDSNVQHGKLIIDYQGYDEKDRLIGVSVLGTDKEPTELEFWSMDSKWDQKGFPEFIKLTPVK